ncbi:MAG TPA: MBL fold metallo-hydrolase [Chitinophagaceae bacterium]
MGLFFASLNSGSNGNSYYVGNDTAAVLVDAGLSCREIESRMKRLDLDLRRVKAIFISHEHTDHIKGVELLSRKHQLPVYVTDSTRRNGRIKLEKHLSKTFEGNHPVEIAGLTVTAFSKFHDAADPYSFVISDSAVNVGVFTDIGRPCANLIHHFKRCHAAFLESNYDEVMLQNGSYPYYLKKRISGGHGHLSNKEALQLFLEHRAPWMSHLVLSHLSQQNNTPEIVQQLFNAHAAGVEMIVASRHEPTAVFRVTASNIPAVKPTAAVQITQQLQIQFS